MGQVVARHLRDAVLFIIVAEAASLIGLRCLRWREQIAAEMLLTEDLVSEEEI